MKRSHFLVISCACALVLALFGLSACGGGSGASSSNAGSGSSGNEAQSSNGEDGTASTISADDVKGIFTQLVAGMSDYYKGATPVGEQLYYAGGADGANAVFALIVPESGQSMIFVGPATVEEGTNKLTVTDQTTGSSIAFFVTSNDDGTVSFSMGEQYGAAIMTRCSSTDIVNALSEVVASAANAANAANQAAEQEGSGQQ